MKAEGKEEGGPRKTAALAQRAADVLAKQPFASTVGQLELALLAQFPASHAESWDRTGMTVGDPAALIKGVAVALDPTVQAVRQTADLGANVLVTHHPAYLEAPQRFGPAASVSQVSGALVYEAISRGVALLGYHTALDVSPQAQTMLPGMLSLRFEGVLEPVEGLDGLGYGQACAPQPDEAGMTVSQLAARCLAVFGRPPRVWGGEGALAKRIATCTGSAGNLGRAALAASMDVLVCGEIKYHDALPLSQAGLAIIELGHDVSELPFTAVLADAVRGAGVPADAVMMLDQGGNWSHPESTRV